MKWRIEFSNRAGKFARKHGLMDTVTNQIVLFLKTLNGNPGAPDVKMLKGKWKGYYRIRISDIRIVFDLDKDKKVVFVESIDRRDKAYR